MLWACQESEDRFDMSQTVLVGEVLKIFLSLLILMNEGGGSVQTLSATCALRRTVIEVVGGRGGR